MKTNNPNTTASSFLKIVRDNSFGRVKRKYRKPTAFIGYWEALARTK
ncbi:hypothetical protein [Pontimicrobium aquaticum]|nr:hypothetical protein [Pontimicrobium aquaticum]